MQNVLDTGKRVFSAAIAAATIAFSIGAGALLSPIAAEAATSGSLIKGTSLSTVYYQGYDGMRYAFPNEKTYFSWYADFSDVVTISDSALAAISLGGNVVVRPGTHFIKITSDNKVYAVGRHGVLHWIESETAAVDLAGSNWASIVIDVPDVFWDDYSVGTSLMSASAFEGAVFEMGGATYVSWDGEMRELTSAGMTANNIWSKFVLDGANIDDSSLSLGTSITSEMLAMVDAAQTEEGSTATTGDITISRASSMPVGASVTGGANAVEVFSFDVEAGSVDASLDSVVLSMIGAGSTANISSVYLYEGNSRLTESRSVNASTRMVTFSNIGLDVASGDTHTLTARVTMATAQAAADTFGFKIASASDVTGSGDVAGSFPITGNIFTLTSQDSGTVTVTKTGTIADPTIGEDDAEIGMFKITASGSEAASIEMITLNVDQAADHSDFKLWDGSTLLANGTDIGSDLVSFDLTADPFAIEEGGNNIFAVTANIGGQDADTIKVAVENAVDVVAIGGDYGFGMTVDIGTSGTYDDTGSACTSSSSNCSFSTIIGGEVTIAFNGPSSGDVQIDSQDQELFAFSITAAQDVTIKDLDLIVAADDDNDGDPTDGVEAGAGTTDDDGLINTGAEANIKDIKIVNADTGATVWSSLELDTVTDSEVDETSLTGAAEDALQIIDFTDDLPMDAGETLNLMVTADIDNSLTSGETMSVALDISGLSIDDANGDALAAADIVPGSDLTGYNQTARASTLTFTIASTPGDVTTIDGTDGVTVLGINAAVNDASDVTITDFTLSVYGDDDGSGTSTIGGEAASDVNDYIESCSLYEDTVLLDGPEGPASNGQTIRFSGINWTIEAGSIGLMTVKCNFANTSTSGSVYFSFDIADEDSDVVAEDDDGDTLAAAFVIGDAPNGGTTLASANVVTLADSGSLAITAASGTPTADFVLTSSSNNSVAMYRFTATNEAFNIETLTFTEEQAEDDHASADATTYANNISLVTISYPKADGTTGTKSVAMSGNEAKFSSLDMYVAVGAPKDVTVKVNVPLTDRDAGGSATSGEKIRMGFSDGDNSGTESFKAVGVGSGTTLTEASSGIVDLGDDAVGTDGIHTFVVKETKPTITLSSLSPSGSAVVGRSEALRFNVAASSNEDVVLNQMVFKINTTDNATVAGAAWNECDVSPAGTETTQADFDLYNLTDDGTATTLDLSSAVTDNTTPAEMGAGTNNPWTLLTSTGVICTGSDDVLAFAHLTLPTSEIIPAGVTKTFALYFDSTGASSASDDSVRFDLPTDPIVGTYLEVDSASDETTGTFTSAETTMVVANSALFAVGDVVVLDADGTGGDGVDAGDERMLITALTDGTTITVVRGYLNSVVTADAATTATDDLLRLPGSLLWKDDGVTGTSGGADDFWGSYLVDNLTINGGTLVF